jgi:hypothetical protein
MKRELLHHGEVFGSVTDHHPCSVLPKHDIKGSLDDVLDLPVDANRFATQVYRSGFKLLQAAMALLEQRLTRDPLLSRWFLSITAKAASG